MMQEATFDGLKSAGQRRLAVLLTRTAQGDEAAFAELYTATELKMRLTVARLVTDATEIEDLLQDAYLKIWRSAHLYNASIAPPITWMMRVVRNCAIDRLRRPRRSFCELGEEALSVADDTVDPSASFDQARLVRHAYTAMRRLPPARAALLEEAYLEDLSREVLARKHNVPESTIKTWIRRSIATVRSQMPCETLN